MFHRSHGISIKVFMHENHQFPNFAELPALQNGQTFKEAPFESKFARIDPQKDKLGLRSTGFNFWNELGPGKLKNYHLIRVLV